MQIVNGERFVNVERTVNEGYVSGEQTLNYCFIANVYS
jgi:hypothetical protein